MIHDKVEELLGAYAIHATTSEETAQIDAHLASCPRCRAEVAAHEEVAAMLGTTGGEPPGGLWEKIASSLEPPPANQRPAGPALAPALAWDRGAGAGEAPPGATRPVPGRVTDLRNRANLGKPNLGKPNLGKPNLGKKVTMSLLGAAAAAVIAFLGAQVVSLQDQVHALKSAVGVQKVLDAPHLTVELQSPAHSPAATVVVAPSGTAYWLTSELGPLPAGKTYQLWGLVRGKPVSLSLIGPEPGTVAGFRVEAAVTQLMVTAEPEGGTPAPTTRVLAQGEVRQA